MAVIKNGHPLFAKTMVKDVMGKTVSYVKSYNTKTKEATVYLHSKKSDGKDGVVVVGRQMFYASPDKCTNRAATARVKLTGSYLVDKETGKKIEI